MQRVWLVGLVALGALGAGGCSQFSVRRAALVPHQQPIARSGQSMGSAAGEVSIGDATLLSPVEPSEVEGANAGVVIPRHEINAAARLRVSEDMDIGFVWDHGLEKGARSVDTDQPDPDNGDVYGGGLSMFYSAPTSNPDFRIGLGADVLMYSVPNVEYRTCFDNCGGATFSIVDKSRDNTPVVSVGVVPSLRVNEGLTVFGGLNVRNHPTIPKSAIEGVEVFDDEDVESGPANFIASAGVELTIANGIRGMAYVYQPVYMDPVSYGPTLGVAFTVPLGTYEPPPTYYPPPAQAPPPAY